MGMYTELFLQVQLNGDTPKDVINTLLYMGDEYSGEEEIEQPFEGSRWDFMFKCNSHYHFPLSIFKLTYLDYVNEYLLFVRCDFKNYENEVGNFLDWVAPWVEDTYGHYAGHYIYEGDKEPTRIIFQGGKLVGKEVEEV